MKFKAVDSLDIQKLPKNLDFPTIESELQQRWAQSKVYEFSDKIGPIYAIDTPPPTVSGSLHVGHIFSYTQTDILARFHRMNGKNVFYPMGCDDNGLPTERRVQNYFHIRCEPSASYEPGLTLPPILSVMSEKEIQEKKLPQKNLSRKNFIEHCHRLTVEDEKQFKAIWGQMGLSVDWSMEYATIDDRSRTLAQLSFLDLFHKNELYQVEAPTIWDTDFQTAVAQAELEDRETPGAFHSVRFQVAESDEFFIIATTRPELLPACVAIAAHPDDSRYQKWIGKKAISPLFGESVPIIGSPLVQPDKGTGIMMICTFGDQMDVQWWREHHLPLKQIIGRDGRLQSFSFSNPRAQDAYSKVQGKTIKQAQKIMVEMLQQSGDLTEPPKPIQHAVKFYEKGDRPVEILTTRQWFVRLLDKKDRMIEAGKKIKWHPEYMEARYRNWTENLAMDWCISRQRFFGVSIPVWYPIDAEGRIVYEKPIIPKKEQLPIDPTSDVPPGMSESQRGKPNGFFGEPDVFDTWFTSSLTPQLASHWELDPARHQRIFPMDLRPQSHEIIRTWAFYTIAKSLLHENKIPWKNIAISGWVLDPDRKKMSKSKGNVVTPKAFIDEHGADAVRYWSGLARYGVDTAFDPNVMKVGRRLVTKLFNAGKFVLQNGAPAAEVTEPLDLAFLEKLKTLSDQCRKHFENYESAQALQDAEKFFWTHFTDSYLELVKGRTWVAPGVILNEMESRVRASAVHATRLALKTFLKLFAPFVPYTTETVWQWAFADECESIHRACYPGSEDFAGIANGLPSVFDAALAAQAAVNQQKTLAKVSIARPVVSLCFRLSGKTKEALLPGLRDVQLATKTQTVQFEIDESFEPFKIEVIKIEFGPDEKSNQN